MCPSITRVREAYLGDKRWVGDIVESDVLPNDILRDSLSAYPRLESVTDTISI